MNSPAKPALHHRLLKELSAVEKNLDGVDRTVRVCSFALKALSDDVSEDVAVVLEAIHYRLKGASDHVTDALNLMPELLQVERAS